MPIAVIDELAKVVSTNSAADGIDCIEIEVGLCVVPFCRRALDLVADAEIQSKFWKRFPVILKVNAVVDFGGRREGSDPRAACPCRAACSGRSQKERSEPIAGRS